jgi:hypothetical protein
MGNESIMVTIHFFSKKVAEIIGVFIFGQNKCPILKTRFENRKIFEKKIQAWL